MRPSLKYTLLAGTFATITLTATPATAQLSLEGLIEDVVNAAASAAAGAVSGAVSEVTQSGSKSAKAPTVAVATKWPANSEFKRYAYDEEVKLPKTIPGGLRGGVARYESHDGKWMDMAIYFDSLPLEHAIVRVHGNGATKIAVFTDPTCPYSKQLERNLNKMDNVTIYTIMAPILGNNRARSEPIIDAIYCQKDNQARAQAFDNYMLNGVEPVQVAGCPQVAMKHLKSIQGVRTMKGHDVSNVSPAIVFSNNIAVTGAWEVKDIQGLAAVKNPMISKN